MPQISLLLLIATLLIGAPPSSAQDRSRPNNGKGPPRPSLVEPHEGERIAWYGTLDAARAEAKRTGKPILLVSGAPHCGTTPGVW
jgi:hypothetical protein